MSSGTVISASQVLDSLGHAKTNMPSFDEARAEFTRQYLTALLKLTGGNVSRAARLADRNRTDFHKLLKKFDIDSSKFKS
jgi:two-component system response regulator GlrR